MNERSPAFQFYPKDYESDENVKQMTLEQEGAYLRLLCHGWLHGSIPADTPSIARICRVPTAKMNRLWPGISPCFKLADAGRLVNPRQEKERAKQETFREGRARAGKKGAAIRHGSAIAQPQQTDGTAKVLPEAKSSFPFPSPSAVSVSVSGRNERSEQAYQPAGKPNPWITSTADRLRYESEALRLVREIAEARQSSGSTETTDGAEIMATAAHYEGAPPGRQKTNPANMGDDRLVNTVNDLRATLKAEREKRSGSDEAPDIESAPQLAAEFLEWRLRQNNQETIGQAMVRWLLERGIPFGKPLQVAVSQHVRRLSAEVSA